MVCGVRCAVYVLSRKENDTMKNLGMLIVAAERFWGRKKEEHNLRLKQMGHEGLFCGRMLLQMFEGIEEQFQ